LKKLFIAAKIKFYVEITYEYCYAGIALVSGKNYYCFATDKYVPVIFLQGGPALHALLFQGILSMLITLASVTAGVKYEIFHVSLDSGNDG